MTLRFPTPHKYDRLGAAARRLARIPRYGRLIAMLPRERFRLLVSAAATIWEVYNYVADDTRDETGLLDDGLKTTWGRKLGWHVSGTPPRMELAIRRWQVRLARDLLGAIAFEMFLGESGDGKSRPLFRMERDVDEFLNRAFDRMENSGAYRTARNKRISGEHLWTDWGRLKAMDSHGLKHLVFNATDERLIFTDITTQTFFAAYWACRWANDTDRAVVREWLPERLVDARTNKEYLEFWRLAAEMPVEACGDGTCYEALFSPLYDGSWTDEEGNPIRSTELMYRSWERLKETEAGKVFRKEFRRIRRDWKDRERCVVARGLLKDHGESQFLSLCEGKQGAKDTGLFQIRAADQNYKVVINKSVRLSSYRLHRYTVSNVEYELFDPRRRTCRAFKDEVSRLPVVTVSWYDAWCFARWLGEIKIDGEWYRVELPTEAEWKYAYCAGSEKISVDLHGWMYKDYSPPEYDYLCHARKQPNAWGFCDLNFLHCEWSSDCYDLNFHYRGNGTVCQDNERVACEATDSNSDIYLNVFSQHPGWSSALYVGFRLAAVPLGRDVRR